MIEKVLCIIFLVGIVSGTHLYGIIGESYHAPQPYKFGYQVSDKDSTQHRHEESDGHGNVRGSYGYTDDKGQYREVHYVADKGGFRAQVKTNEAGTANQSPAHVDVKADPPHNHFSNHHVPHHQVPHLHIPVHHEDIKIHHHIPHHHEIKIPHHIPHHEEIKIHHHIPHHEEIKIHHHVPHHEGIKFHHHIPQHHELKIEPLNHHGFKNHHHFSSPLSSLGGFNNFSPLHGFSYNPSAFHGYGHWPFQDSNSYSKQPSWKEHKGYQFSNGHGLSGHQENFHGLSGHGLEFGGLSGFDGDFEGLSSLNKDKYEKILEKIKAYNKHEPLGLLKGLKDHTTENFDKKVKSWKYGHGNLNF